jgi:hypothetical protein
MPRSPQAQWVVQQTQQQEEQRWQEPQWQQLAAEGLQWLLECVRGSRQGSTPGETCGLPLPPQLKQLGAVRRVRRGLPQVQACRGEQFRRSWGDRRPGG